MAAKEANQVNPSQVLADGLAAIEQTMYAATGSHVDILRDASHHILNAGGKRIRPRLLMLAYLALGGADIQYAAKPSAAIELLHTASVVHDDINDHGLVRRGRPSVNSIWGRTFALLTGDFLFTAVYRLMASYQHLNIDLAETATDLVEGETLQASAIKNNNFTHDIYMQIIALKTASLFRSAAVIGAKLAQATPGQIQALSNFGFNVGMAFQIVDDILDLVADEKQLGKTAGIDIEQGRGIAVALHEPNGSRSAVQDDPVSSIKRKLLKGNAIEKGMTQAKQLVKNAVASLAALPDTPAKTELIHLANLVVTREY